MDPHLRLCLILLGCIQVHDSAASRSSWVNILDLEEEPQQQQHDEGRRAGAAAGSCADAAVQTDGVPTESAGSTAAADGAAAAAGLEEEDVMSPQRQPHHQQQQQHRQQWAAGDDRGLSSCEGAAGSALLSAARLEIQRLQELNQQLLQFNAQGEWRQLKQPHIRTCLSTTANGACQQSAGPMTWLEC